MKWSKQDILECAKSLGLDPFPTDFHIVPADVLYDIAARGIPGRYSHWSFGRDFQGGITRHDFGMSRIYELVINSNPSQAYVLDTNSEVINLLIRGHVYAHTDFFKHNRVFNDTNRDMPNTVTLRAKRIREYEEEFGEEEVRKMIDTAQTVEFYVDKNSYNPVIEKEVQNEILNPYDDILSLGKSNKTPKEPDNYNHKKRFAGLPCEDILSFLIEEAPLENWQKDILSIVRNDGLYFWPQIKTRICNEGYASFWHSKIMHQLDITDGEFVEYAKANAGVVSSHVVRLNPYWLGLQIFRDIEKRYGMEKVFEVRKLSTDLNFIRNYLTKELIEELGLIRYYIESDSEYDYYILAEDGWKEVRNAIINDLGDRFPSVEVVDKDYNNQGILLLKHNYYGRKLKKYSAVKVLQQLQYLWGKPVYLETDRNGSKTYFKP